MTRLKPYTHSKRAANPTAPRGDTSLRMSIVSKEGACGTKAITATTIDKYSNVQCAYRCFCPCPRNVL
jgi:hypothetical protein